MKYDKDDPVYWQAEVAEEFYMIYEGRVKLFAQNGCSFMSYSAGKTVGDSDALLECTRDSKAQAAVDSTLYVIKME